MPRVVGAPVQNRAFLEFAAGFSNQGAWLCQVTKMPGGLVILEGIFKRDAGAFVAGTTYTPVATIPAEFAPDQTHYSNVMAGLNAGNTGSCIVYESGTIEYRHNTGAAAYMSFGGITWKADGGQ